MTPLVALLPTLPFFLSHCVAGGSGPFFSRLTGQALDLPAIALRRQRLLLSHSPSSIVRVHFSGEAQELPGSGGPRLGAQLLS